MVLLGWENPIGWLAFLSLVPFLLLYFVRPKPVELEVPSLMFFMKSQYTNKERSFLKRFRFDILFLLQLLILCLLSLYFINPFTSFGKDILVDRAIFVLDISASMQVDNRFSEALSLAKEHLARSNTFLLVSNVPRVIGEDLSNSDAQRLLKQLPVTAGRSNIGDTLMLASQYAKDEETKVYVLSDLIPTEGVSLEAAKNALRSKNIIPEFLTVKNKKKHDNVGIVDVRVDDASSTVYFKNYGDKEKTLAFTVNDDVKSLTIKPQFIEPYSFKTQLGVTQIKLTTKDDFSVDNVAYISIPDRKSISVLLITDRESKYLKAALQSSGKVDVTVTPTTKLPKKDFDVYVLHEITGKLNKDVLSQLTAAVEKGKGLVIHAEPESNTIDYGQLLSLSLGSLKHDGVVEITQLTKLTQDIVFGDVKDYFATKQEKGLTLATVQNSSVLSVSPLGAGKVVYYGIIEDASTFPLQPSYPIFWTDVVRYLAGQGDLNDYNLDTGTTLALPLKKEITTPSKKTTTNTVLFDEVGLYKIDDRIIAANLADEKESDIDAESIEASKNAAPLTLAAEEKKYTLEKTVLLLAGALLLLELLFMKLRREI